uniref:C2H2-type domain-containing protein n=1 Tax=Cuerna arida TaxID=1464854 RepID=A0A1B6EV26_9HEMI
MSFPPIPMTSLIKEEVVDTVHDDHDDGVSVANIDCCNNVADIKFPITNNVYIKEEEDLDDTTLDKRLISNIKEEVLSCEEDVSQDEIIHEETPSNTTSQLKTEDGCTSLEPLHRHEHFTESIKMELYPEDCSETEQNLLCSVSIKEDHTVGHYDVYQQTNCERQEDVTFGQHFLLQCSEPDMSEQHHANQDSLASSSGNRNISSHEANSDQFYHHQNKKVRDSSHFLGKWKRRKCAECNFITNNPRKWKLHHDLYEHKKPKRPEMTLFCQFCPYRTTFRSLLHQHVLKKHSFGFEPIDCPYCNFRSLSITEIEAHITKKHSDVKILIDCPHCDYKCRPTNLNYHIMAKHTLVKNYACLCCDYKCIIAQNMRRHLLKMHNKIVKDDSLIRIKN